MQHGANNAFFDRTRSCFFFHSGGFSRDRLHVTSAGNISECVRTHFKRHTLTSVIAGGGDVVTSVDLKSPLLAIEGVKVNKRNYQQMLEKDVFSPVVKHI